MVGAWRAAGLLGLSTIITITIVQCQENNRETQHGEDEGGGGRAGVTSPHSSSPGLIQSEQHLVVLRGELPALEIGGDAGAHGWGAVDGYPVAPVRRRAHEGVRGVRAAVPAGSA